MTTTLRTESRKKQTKEVEYWHTNSERPNKFAILPMINFFILLVVLCQYLPQSASLTNQKTPFSTASMDEIRPRIFGEVEKLLGLRVQFEIFRLFMKDDGKYPNNPRYPLLLYKKAWLKGEREGRRAIERSNTWTSPWAWGVFPYHHYHSKAWELLVCVQGEANVQLGGDTGPIVLIETGDVVFVPPGFAHKQLDDKSGFTLLGSYPKESLESGSPIDTLIGLPTPEQRKNIDRCRVPEDPLCGTSVQSLSRRFSSSACTTE